MKILIIIPITGLNKYDIEERMAYLRSIANPGTEIDYLQIKEGPPVIECLVDHVQASSEVLKYVRQLEKDGYDAIIIWCGGDPGVEAARTIMHIPVIGPGEAMRLIASTQGKKICGVNSGLPVLDARKDLKKTASLLRKDIDKKVKQGYDSFYLECLALWGMGQSLREETGIPVVDGAEASLKVAEMLAQLKLKPSRIAYPKYPPPHRR